MEGAKNSKAPPKYTISPDQMACELANKPDRTSRLRSEHIATIIPSKAILLNSNPSVLNRLPTVWRAQKSVKDAANSA